MSTQSGLWTTGKLTVMRLRDGGHQAGEIGQEKEEKDSKGDKPLPKVCSGVVKGQWLDTLSVPRVLLWARRKVKPGTGLAPGTRVSPALRLTLRAQRGEAEPLRLKMAQHGNTTFYRSWGQRERRCQNISAVTKGLLPAYVWHFHSSTARFTQILLKSIDYKRCQHDWLTRKM